MKKISLIFIILVLSYLIFSAMFNSIKNLSIVKNISKENKTLIYKYIFPYKYINVLQYKLDTVHLNGEMASIANSEYIRFEGPKKFEIFGQNTNLQKLTNYGNLTAGTHNDTPGTAYLDFNDSRLFLVSSRGLIAYFDNFEVGETLKFNIIPNNVQTFIGEKQFSQNKWFSIKDVMISDGKIYISFTNELKPNCWNTSIIVSEINIKKLEFKDFFISDQCVKEKNKEKSFNALQSGGRIINFDKDNILFSTGDYRQRFLSQEDSSVFGKIISINKDTGKYKIISKGHRNPQGLLFQKSNNIIINTEHGPKGGDEINLNNLPLNKTLNFGWPIASYGEHYKSEIEKNSKIYEKYPFKKSHSKFGFIEPLHYFVPSIGISEIIHLKENKFIVSSLRSASIYTFELNNNKIENLTQIYIGERIRDMIYNKNLGLLLMFLEDTASIGVVKI